MDGINKIIIEYYERSEKEKPLREKLHHLFGLGWEVGKKEYTSAAKHPFSCGYDQLRKVAEDEFEERDRLIDELVKEFFKDSQQ